MDNFLKLIATLKEQKSKLDEQKKEIEEKDKQNIQAFKNIFTELDKIEKEFNEINDKINSIEKAPEKLKEIRQKLIINILCIGGLGQISVAFLITIMLGNFFTVVLALIASVMIEAVAIYFLHLIIKEHKKEANDIKIKIKDLDINELKKQKKEKQKERSLKKDERDEKSKINDKLIQEMIKIDLKIKNINGEILITEQIRKDAIDAYLEEHHEHFEHTAYNVDEETIEDYVSEERTRRRKATEDWYEKLTNNIIHS